MNFNEEPINVKSGDTLTLYSKSYQFLTTTDGIINTSNITCYDETLNEYVYSIGNINNQITLTNDKGKMVLNIRIVRNHIYTLTFVRKDIYSENKTFKLKIKGV